MGLVLGEAYRVINLGLHFSEDIGPSKRLHCVNVGYESGGMTYGQVK